MSELKKDVEKLVKKHDLKSVGEDYTIVDYLMNCIEVYEGLTRIK